MKNRNKKKILLSAVLTIVLCLSLIAGTTFALFTSESKVNIAITSGKVKVEAEIVDPKIYSATDDATLGTGGEAGTIDEGPHAATYYYEPKSVTTVGDGSFSGTFTNSGTAYYDAAENELTLDRVTPGDKVNFTVQIDNLSNVNIKYRVVVTVTSGLKLFRALKVKINNTNLTGVSRVGNWTWLAAPIPNEDNITDVPVEIYLPIEAGNEYQDLSTAMTISVEAVQGNAHTSDEILATTVEAVAPTTVVTNDDKETTAETVISDTDSLVTVTIPSGAKLTSSNPDDDLSLALKVTPQDTSNEALENIGNITVLSNKESASYDVSVLLVVNGEINDDSGHAIDEANTEYITVKMFVGTGLTGVELYHTDDDGNTTKITDFTYVDGFITFNTTSFSEYTVLYNADYAYETDDGIVVLGATELPGVYTTDDDVYVTVTEDETGKVTENSIYPDTMTALGTATVTEIADGASTTSKRDGVLVQDVDGVEYVYTTDGGSADVFLYSARYYEGTTFIVPAFVTKFDSSCFYGNNTITEVVFTNQIESAYKSFAYNTSITDINFGSMTYIPNRMFHSANITELTIPETVTKISDFAFYGDSVIETLIIENAAYIGYKAFDACSKLKYLDIGGDNVAIMGWAGRQVASIETIVIRGANATVDLDYAPAGQAKGAFVFDKTQQSGNPGTMPNVNFYVANDTVAEYFDKEFNTMGANRAVTVTNDKTWVYGTINAAAAVALNNSDKVIGFTTASATYNYTFTTAGTLKVNRGTNTLNVSTPANTVDNCYDLSTSVTDNVTTYTVTLAPAVAVLNNETYYGNLNNALQAAEEGDTVTLLKNVDLAGVEWAPVGSSSKRFVATFDGGNHTISNFTLDGTGEAHAFIEYVETGATIKNVKFANVAISGLTYAATVVWNGDGANNLTFSNIEVVSGSVTGTSYAAGLFFDVEGENNIITNCINRATITSDYSAGGIGAWMYFTGDYSSVSNCVNYGDVTGGNRAGGIFGNASGMTITNSTNHGAVTSNGGMPAGGIVGVLGNVAITFDHCTNTGTITNNGSDASNSAAGGILGHTPSKAATFNYCINTGNVSSANCTAGGICNALYGGTTANYCYNSGAITAAKYAGGITPKALYGSSDYANNCLNAGTVTSSSATAYPICNNKPSCYYYDGDTLKSASDNTEPTAEDALAVLNGGLETPFFAISDGKIKPASLID